MKPVRHLLAAAALCAGTAAVHAHNLWLLPSTTVLSKADWITVDAAVSNDLFFFNHRPLNLANLRVTAPDGSAVKPENAAEGKLRSVFDLNLTSLDWYIFSDTAETKFTASFKNIFDVRYSNPGYGGFDFPSVGRVMFFKLAQAF